jgi:hypothetical protein
MQDAITNDINQSGVQGLYLDGSSMGGLEKYFASGELRFRAAATISANASRGGGGSELCAWADMPSSATSAAWGKATESDSSQGYS